MAFGKVTKAAVRKGLCSLSMKKSIRRRRRKLKNAQLNGLRDQDNVNELDAQPNRSEPVLRAAEALLTSQTSVGSVDNVVWASPKSSPFIVTPLRKRAVISITPTSSPRLISTPIPSPTRSGNSRLKKRVRRLLVKEFGCNDISPMSKRAKCGTMTGTLTDDPSNSADNATMNCSATTNDVPSNSAEIATMSISATTTDVTSNSSGNATMNSSATTTDVPSNFTGGTTRCAHWRYERLRGLTRFEFRRLTGLNQENFEVLYSFLGGDEVCNHLKYDYQAQTPKKKRPSRRSVKKNIGSFSAKETVMHTWKDSSRLSSKDKLIMTLVRLRRGFALEDIALMYGISKTQASTIVFVWVQFLNLQFKRIQKAMCVTRHDQPKWKIAPCYRRYKNFRMVIDTTEIRIQSPYNYQQQGNTYSPYKAGPVILYLIATSGWGSISFVSPGFEGSMSDRKIFQESGLLGYLEPGDLIIVDRGFTVKDITDEVDVTVVHPPFTNKGKPLCPEDNMLTKRIASDRVHVERAIRKVKCFNILKHVTNKMLPILDQLVYVCACLVNFDASLLSAG